MRDVNQAVRDLKAVLEPQAGGSGSGESAKGAPPDAIAAELRTSLTALSARLRELRDADFGAAGPTPASRRRSSARSRP